jgi:hypothetical protein
MMVIDFKYEKERMAEMAYTYENAKGNTYYLHSKETTLKGGNTRTIYYFAKEQKEGTLDEVPEGYTVSETSNGLPVLKKKDK